VRFRARFILRNHAAETAWLLPPRHSGPRQ
jgi:hypothetical protein